MSGIERSESSSSNGTHSDGVALLAGDPARWARYLWAAPASCGREVLDAGCGPGYGLGVLSAACPSRLVGVDADAVLAAEARGRCPDAERIVHADLDDLPLPGASFDVALCFGGMPGERLESVLAEFRRVLRPDGLVLLWAGSDGEPTLHPSDEAAQAEDVVRLLGEHFPHTATYGQPLWRVGSNGASHEGGMQAAKLGGDLIAASGTALPDLHDPLSGGHANGAGPSGNGSGPAAPRGLRHTLAQTSAREATLRERLRETSTALLEAGEQLAELPQVKHRLAELNGEHAELWGRFNEIEGSRSWRLTAPLRRVRHFIQWG